MEQLKNIIEKDFKIQCGNVTKPKNEKRLASFDLMIYGDNALKFMKEIGTSHNKHIKRFKIMIGRT